MEEDYIQLCRVNNYKNKLNNEIAALHLKISELEKTKVNAIELMNKHAEKAKDAYNTYALWKNKNKIPDVEFKDVSYGVKYYDFLHNDTNFKELHYKYKIGDDGDIINVIFCTNDKGKWVKKKRVAYTHPYRHITAEKYMTLPEAKVLRVLTKDPEEARKRIVTYSISDVDKILNTTKKQKVEE